MTSHCTNDGDLGRCMKRHFKASGYSQRIHGVDEIGVEASQLAWNALNDCAETGRG